MYLPPYTAPAMSSDCTLEPFVASGHPLHTRTLTVDALRTEPGHVRLDGAILDLRKCGFVPTGGELQTAGFIHHMQLSFEVDAANARILAVSTAQPTVAFEATPLSGGDSCRDPAPRLSALVGERLDAGFVRRLGALFGGALGCSHLLTLAQLMGSSAPRFLSAQRKLEARAPGDRIGKRSLFLDGFERSSFLDGFERSSFLDGFERSSFLDGFERSEGGLEIALQLSEFLSRPESEVRYPLDRLEHQHELRLLARIDRAVSRIETLDAVERERDIATLASAVWRSRSEALTALVGGPALRGLATRVLAQLGDEEANAPLRDALLNLAPGIIQCLAALSHRLVAHFSGGSATAPVRIPRELSVGGTPDSCYMWRSDGPLARARAAAGR
jgi:hypothetical protein